ncbi:UNVERIFIED_CONTAM: hypothetical protein FKN15_008212 [Acipenser sinensis]
MKTSSQPLQRFIISLYPLTLQTALHKTTGSTLNQTHEHCVDKPLEEHLTIQQNVVGCLGESSW